MDKPPWTYESLTVGEEFADSYDLTLEMVGQYIAATGDDHPWYRGPSPFGGPVAPAGLVGFLHYRLPRTRYYCEGGVHAKHECENVQPAFVGSRITTRGWLVDKYSRRGRAYAVIAFESRDQDGRVVCRGRNTNVLRYEPPSADRDPS